MKFRGEHSTENITKMRAPLGECSRGSFRGFDAEIMKGTLEGKSMESVNSSGEVLWRVLVGLGAEILKGTLDKNGIKTADSSGGVLWGGALGCV